MQRGTSSSLGFSVDEDMETIMNGMNNTRMNYWKIWSGLLDLACILTPSNVESICPYLACVLYATYFSMVLQISHLECNKPRLTVKFDCIFCIFLTGDFQIWQLYISLAYVDHVHKQCVFYPLHTF
jgi:hypothetical protein